MDKTELIRALVNTEPAEITLFTRPRRFGKTLVMSMLASFFDIRRDSKALFEGLKIAEDQKLCELWMNQWPVIFLSFKDAGGETFEDAYGLLQSIISQLYVEHAYLEKCAEIDESYKEIFARLKRRQGNKTDVQISLRILMRMMQIYYGKQVILLIDEYDVPMAKAGAKAYYNEMLDVIGTMMSQALKDNTALKFSVITGCLRISKESIFTGTNNFVADTIADERFSSFLGFTDEEVRKLLENTDNLEYLDRIKKWYDGFVIGTEKDIYNPWSIMNYAKRKKLISYWVNTSANSMIKTALKQANYTFKNQYDKLIKDGKLDTYVSMQTSFFEEADNSTLWGLFVNAGYLTVTKEIDLLKGKYRIEIPNKEVKQEFIKLTEYQLGLSSGTLDTVTESLAKEDQETFLESYQEILMVPSYHDLQKENSYHMMMLGMCLCLNKDYEIISNREVGKGRDDLILKAKDEKKTSFVLEFKYLKEDKKDLEKALDELSNKAIQQIKDNKYDYGLKGKVIYIGLAHHG